MFNKLVPEVIYYPQFKSDKDLTNHYYRARWYITPQNNKKIFFSTYSNVKKTSVAPPYFMKNYPNNGDSIVINKNKILFLLYLMLSPNILIWKEEPRSKWSRRFFILFWSMFKRHITNIETESKVSKEWSSYCGFSWRKLLTNKERKELIDESKEKLISIHNSNLKYETAAVFGTGPSLETASEYDFTDTLCIACNSIVQNEKLLESLDPLFITAGDVVSHFGISRYAEVFRNDLLNVLKTRNCFFVTTSTFGYLFYYHYPEVRNKIILISQGKGGGNCNLLEDFRLPELDSTMNIHMIPLATTFCDKVYITGCDGKNPDQSKNEDFWAHSSGSQYHELVNTGHISHPRFSSHRKVSTYSRYIASLSESFSNGAINGKTFYYFGNTFIPILQSIKIDLAPGQNFSNRNNYEN